MSILSGILSGFIAATLVSVFILLRNRKKFRTQLIFTTIINNFQIKIISMQLDKQKFVNTILTLVNSKTQEPVSAQFSNIVLTSSDTSIFTADTDVNNDAIIDVIGVEPGSGTLTVSADATFTDPNTNEEKTVNETAEIQVTITEPPAGAIDTDLVVSFSEAQPLPV